MAGLQELEQRLGDALQRIAAAQTAADGTAAETASVVASLMDENAQLTERLAALEDAPPPEAGADPAELDALRAELAAAQDANGALEQALQAERAEREAQAESLAEAIAERGRLMDSRDAAEAAREDLAERAQRLAERETLKAAEARAEIEDLRGRIDALEAGADKLREANRQLRSNNAALREAHSAGVADADLINAGLKAELEALTAVRAADRAELDGVLAALRPILEEAADA